jgi:hypothetical protein
MDSSREIQEHVNGGGEDVDRSAKRSRTEDHLDQGGDCYDDDDDDDGANANRVHNPTDTCTSGSDINMDSVALFTRAKDRIDAANRELAMAQKNMDQVRAQMRSNRVTEPDSLLYLDDHAGVLTAVMEFLTVPDVARCERTCRTLQKRAKHCWHKLEEDLNLLNDPSKRSPGARDARERVIRYHTASNLSRRIGGMGDSISKHLIVSGLNQYGGIIDSRVQDCCKGEGCDFPEELNFNVFRRDTTNDYELYVRFSRTSDNYCFAEGFVPFRRQDESNLNIILKDMNFSKWPEIVEITRLVKMHVDGAELNNDDLLYECMKELTATVIAIDKTSSEASLVLAQSNFAGTNSGLDGIDNMGDHGFCSPRGGLSCHSHGNIETILKRCVLLGDGVINNRNLASDAKLGMLFTNVEWTDPQDNDRILAVECQWTLNCTYDIV